MSGIIGGAGSKSGVIGSTSIDYEEGTYIPTIVGSGGGSLTCSTDNTLGYTKIGNRVFISGRLSPTSNSVDPAITSTMIFSLPFTIATGTAQSSFCSGNVFLRSGGQTGIQQNQTAILAPSGSTFYIAYLNDNDTSENISGIGTLAITTGWNVWFGFSYQAA
jgi:hypothetical protein